MSLILAHILGLGQRVLDDRSGTAQFGGTAATGHERDLMACACKPQSVERALYICAENCDLHQNERALGAAPACKPSHWRRSPMLDLQFQRVAIVEPIEPEAVHGFDARRQRLCMSKQDCAQALR